MKKLFVVLMMVLGLVGSALAQVQQYGPKGASVEGREYWNSNEGDMQALRKDLAETIKKKDRFQSCDLQRVLMNKRWQTCRTCGYVTKASYPELASSWPTECL